MIQLKSRVKRRSSIMLTIGGVLAFTALGIYSTLPLQVFATPVADSCFTFDSGTGTITAYNEAADPACDVTSLTVPASIGGTPVTAIGPSGFDGATITSFTFPGSITTIGANAFNATNLTSFTLHATGDLTIEDGATSGATISGALDISSGGSLTIGYAFTSVAITNLNLQATNDITLQHGSLAGLGNISSVSIEADRDLLVTDSSLSDMTTTGAVSLHATRNATVRYSSLSNTSSAGATTIAAGGNLVTQSGSLYQYDASSLTLTAGGDLTVEGSAANDINVPTVSIESSGSTLVTGSFASAPAITTLHIKSDGDLTIGSNSFNESSITELKPITAGAVTINGSAFNTTNTLKTVVLNTPGDINVDGSSGLLENPGLETVSITSTLGNISFNGYTTVPPQSLHTLELAATGSLTIANGSGSGLQSLNNLTLTAGTDLSIGVGSFNNTGISSLTLRGATLIVQNGAFTLNSNLTSVYIDSPVATFQPGAFTTAGATFDGSTYDYSNVRILPIYTTDSSNPAGLTDNIDASIDQGGYIINPASYQITYKNVAGTELQPSKSALGKNSDDTLLTSYLSNANPSRDPSLYFRAGNSYSFSAPAINSYVTPVAKTGVYAQGVNVLAFTYLMPGTPNTSISPTIPKQSPISAIATAPIFALIATLALVSVLACAMYTIARLRK